MKELLTLFLLVTLVHSSPAILLFDLNSNQSLTVMQPLLSQNNSLSSAMNNITSLDMNSEFAPLFNFILSKQTIFNQLLPNISIVDSFGWTVSMSQ